MATSPRRIFTKKYIEMITAAEEEIYQFTNMAFEK